MKTDLLKVFWSFLKIGMFTIGGGYAMLPLIKHEVVDKQHWLDEQAFIDGIAAAQSCPGPIAVNIGVYAGFQIARWQGAIAATLGTVLPSFLIILAIAFSFTGWADAPIVQKAFRGLRPCVTALIAVPVTGMVKNAKLRYHRYLLPGIALLLIVFYGISPIVIILFTILAAIWKMLYHKIYSHEATN